MFIDKFIKDINNFDQKNKEKGLFRKKLGNYKFLNIRHFMEVPSNLEEQTLCDDNEKNKVAQTKLDDQIIYKFRGAPLLLQNIDIVYFIFFILNG